MIEIIPSSDKNIFNCLQCNAQTPAREMLYQGIHVLADCLCPGCQLAFYHTLPVGHDLLFPIAFSKDGNLFQYPADAKVWLAQPLIKSMVDGHASDHVQISIQSNPSESDKAIIINCLDSCFGHVFTKLWNISFVRTTHPDFRIVVVVPANMVWLLPEYVDEIWFVHHPLSKMKHRLLEVDNFVKSQLGRFKQVYLSHSYTHLDVRLVKLNDYLKTKRFDLTTFASADKHITFVTREDRFWHPTRWEYFLYKVCVKLGWTNSFKRFFCWRQNRLIRETAKLISKKLDGVTIQAVGIGKTGTLYSGIKDKRVSEMLPDLELEWTNLYAKSHIVIGVHGSNMLIPSALAAGFIEILPDKKIRHIAEDTIQDCSSRYTHFLGRHLPEFSSPRLLSQHVISMIGDFPYLQRNQEGT